jgi:hypothetical protein
MTRMRAALPSPLAAELQAVADTAGVVLVAEANQDEGRSEAVASARGAVIAAVQAGYPLVSISECETLGQQVARDQLRGELLKRVARTARRMRETASEHHDAVRRASRIGLSAREIAAEAGVAPATIRAVLVRATPDDAGAAEATGGDDADDAGPVDREGSWEHAGHAQ